MIAVLETKLAKVNLFDTSLIEKQHILETLKARDLKT